MPNNSNPDPSVFRFFCPANECWCIDDEICIKRTKLLHKNPKWLETVLSKYPQFENCLTCEKGANLMKEYQAGNPVRKKKKTRPCKIPGCENPMLALDLCQTHYQQLQRDTLIRCSTKAHKEDVPELLDIMIGAAEKKDLPLKEVAWLFLVKGALEYHGAP